MATYALCNPDGSIHSVRRGDALPDELELQLILPEGGSFIDLTGTGAFDTMDILDIHNQYKANAKRQKLIKRR